MKVLLVGSSSFIGESLLKFLVKEKYEIVCMARRRGSINSKIEFYEWNLGESIPERINKSIDIAIHLIHDSTMEGSIFINKVIKSFIDLQDKGIPKQIYISSYSAGPHALSKYGITKYQIENEIFRFDDITIVRPGLVIGEGGVYKKISSLANLLPFIPLPDGGSGMVPIIEIESLCEYLVKIIRLKMPHQEENIFSNDLISLRQLILNSVDNNKKPIIVPISSKALLSLLRIIDFFPVKIPINKENVLGFIANQNAKHESTVDRYDS